MPINEDGASQSVRFQYKHEQDDQFILNVEFHQTEIGNTVTIHNLMEEPVSLPLSLYVDIVDYLRERGCIPGGVASKLSSSFGGQMLRPTNKLQPTRVANQQPVHYAPTPAPMQVVAQAPQRQATLHDAQQVQNVYAPQHAVLQADSVMEGGMRTVAGPQSRPAPVDDNRDDPTQEFDGSLSLAAGKLKKQQAGAVDPKKTLKRIVKPGEPEFFDRPTGY